MKITIDLLGLHDHPDVGRSALVALMSVLPSDEVDLAVQEWHAVLAVRAADDRGDLPPFEARASAPEPQSIPPQTQLEPSKARPLGPGTRLEDALSAKTANALRHAGFQVLGDLTIRTGASLLASVDRFGKGALAELEAAMASAGLALAEPASQSAPSASRETDIGKVEPDMLSFEGGGKPEVETTESDITPNGSDTGASHSQEPTSRFEDLDLRQLCRHVGHEVGDARVFDAIGRRKLGDIPEAEVDAVRTAVLGLLL